MTRTINLNCTIGLKDKTQPDVVVHACNPALRRLSQENLKFEACLELQSKTLTHIHAHMHTHKLKILHLEILES
jgi:hypothetical protein